MQIGAVLCTRVARQKALHLTTASIYLVLTLQLLRSPGSRSHDLAFFFLTWTMENLGGPRMPEGKCLFAVVPYSMECVICYVQETSRRY